MELRRYWRVLVRRRRVVRNTFIIVAILGALTVAYSYSNAQYDGRAVLGIRLQPQPSRNAVVDPETAAIENTKSVVLDLDTYASEKDYFQRMSAELARAPYHVKINWTALSGGLKTQDTEQQLFFDWYGSDQVTVQKIVTVAVHQIEAYIPRYHAAILRTAPTIKYVVLTQPSATHISYSKPLIDFGIRAALGLIAGIILAYLIEYLDNTVQDEDDIAEALGTTALVRLPTDKEALLSA